MKRVVAFLLLFTLVGCSSLLHPTGVTKQPPPADLPRLTSIPTMVSIPSIDATSTLEQVGLLPNGEMETPPVSRPMQAAWYKHSPRPGMPGPSVIVGHVDGRGQKGIFYDLKDVKPGAIVQVDFWEYEVYDVVRVKKDQFPTDQVYGDTTASELRLITCGGTFDYSERSYRDNIIVFARLL